MTRPTVFDSFHLLDYKNPTFLLGNTRKQIHQDREFDVIKVQDDLAAGTVGKGVVCLV